MSMDTDIKVQGSLHNPTSEDLTHIHHKQLEFLQIHIFNQFVLQLNGEENEGFRLLAGQQDVSKSHKSP
eukprot:2446559-Karenia_brevis.AAC.1